MASKPHGSPQFINDGPLSSPFSYKLRGTSRVRNSKYIGTIRSVVERGCPSCRVEWYISKIEATMLAMVSWSMPIGLAPWPRWSHTFIWVLWSASTLLHGSIQGWTTRRSRCQLPVSELFELSGKKITLEDLANLF